MKKNLRGILTNCDGCNINLNPDYHKLVLKPGFLGCGLRSEKDYILLSMVMTAETFFFKEEN
jgi:hypothetical protein